MSGVSLSLRRADEGTIGYVETLLERNGLPSSDVKTGTGRFYVGYDHDERIGVGGIETYDTEGLLRSVVVERGARENGVGTALCEALEQTARENGVETLYLLTTTVSEFFEGLDYETVERDAVPEAIRRTTEFADLCPTTATCMRKEI